MDANPDTWREGMKNWREFKIFGVRVMDTRNGRTHLRESWKWPFVGALICWPIALGLSQVAIMAIRARDLSETLAAIAGAAVFWVVLPVYTFRMGWDGKPRRRRAGRNRNEDRKPCAGAEPPLRAGPESVLSAGER